MKELIGLLKEALNTPHPDLDIQITLNKDEAQMVYNALVSQYSECQYCNNQPCECSPELLEP